MTGQEGPNGEKAMANELQNLSDWMQGLLSRSVEEQLRASQRYFEVMQRAGRGELLTRPAGENYWRFVQEEGTRFARDWTTLTVNYYNGLAELGRAWNDTYFEQVLGMRVTEGAMATAGVAHEGPHAAPAPVAPRRVELEMRAASGTEATAAFALENRQNEALRISFLVSDFVSADGTSSLRPPLQIEPSRFTLPAGMEQAVTLRLPVTAEFLPGQPYSATIVVQGYDHLELIVHLLAEPSPVIEAQNMAAHKAAPKRAKAKPAGAPARGKSPETAGRRSGSRR
ncbi:MAG: hypothetical protein ACKV2V_15240 [Blastocatellia bacterium]